MSQRNAMRLGLRRERDARATSDWGPWITSRFAPGSVGPSGWSREITEAHHNYLYCALVRYLDPERDAGRVHLAIRTLSHAEPPWRDLQRIKNELFGLERHAVQVCPPESRLIDQADMYHLWIMAEGFTPGFGLHPDD